MIDVTIAHLPQPQRRVRNQPRPINSAVGVSMEKAVCEIKCAA